MRKSTITKKEIERIERSLRKKKKTFLYELIILSGLILTGLIGGTG